jgi:hypothetical protein
MRIFYRLAWPIKNDKGENTPFIYLSGRFFLQFLKITLQNTEELSLKENIYIYAEFFPIIR